MGARALSCPFGLCLSGGCGSRIEPYDRPAEFGEVAGDGDRDECFAFAALGVQAPPDVVQPLLCFPGGRDDGGGLVLLAVLKRRADFWRPAVVPGGFDQ